MKGSPGEGRRIGRPGQFVFSELEPTGEVSFGLIPKRLLPQQGQDSVSSNRSILASLDALAAGGLGSWRGQKSRSLPGRKMNLRRQVSSLQKFAVKISPHLGQR